MKDLKIKCKICDQGELVKKKIYRLSGMVVFIGYLIIIPSVIGLLLGLTSLGAAGAAVGGVASAVEDYEQEGYSEDFDREALLEVGLSEDLIEDFFENDYVLSEESMELLNDEQKFAIELAQAGKIGSDIGVAAGAAAGAAVAGGAALLGGGMVIFTLIGTAIGWYLIMKKWVLKCKTCGAIAPVDHWG